MIYIPMKRRTIIRILLLSAMFAAACSRDSGLDGDTGKAARISLTVDNLPLSKSSIIDDEDTVHDLNIWVYSSSGDLKETHYLDGLSIRTAGDVDFDTSAGGHSRLVLIGNAGRSLQGPATGSDAGTYALNYGGDRKPVLLVGEGNLSLTATGMRSSVTLFRAMSRIALKAELSEDLKAAGSTLGGNVRVTRVKLCNSPTVFAVKPSDAWNSVRSYKAVAGTPFTDGDCLSAGDLATLQEGGTVYLYSLPNYTGIAYTDRPGAATEASSYIEMTIESDAVPAISEGVSVCRFYANDGAQIGLLGGCSYSCMVSISNEGAAHHWRKDDYRFEQPGTFYAGTRKTIMLHSGNHDPAGISFSLSETPGVSDDGLFRIEGKALSGGLCHGVVLSSRDAGSGTLCAFDSGGTLMARMPLTASYPSFHVPDIALDVTGTECAYIVRGLEEIYASRASDEVYDALYAVSSVESAGETDGIYPEDFIGMDLPSGQLWVNSLQWHRSGSVRSWLEAAGKTFKYRVTLACGISEELNVQVVNEVVGRFASSANHGEVINTSGIPSPKSAVRALDGRSITVSRTGVQLPSGLNGDWGADGWASWYGGTALGGGSSADAFMTVLADGLRWDFGASVTQSLYAKDIPVYIGKMNPWCNDYVRTCVGYYSSSYYVPVGMEYAFMQIGFDPNGYANMGNHSMEVYSMLVFREHDEYTHIAKSFCKTGDTPNQFSQGRNYFDSKGTASWVENGRNCYLICYSGDLYEKFSGVIDDARMIESSSSFSSAEIWESESESGSDKYKYAAPAYGGNGRRNIWLYLYCPYESDGVYKADSNGHAPQAGLVRVHLWSVSEKAVFDYVPAGDWISNGYFIPPWR